MGNEMNNFKMGNIKDNGEMTTQEEIAKIVDQIKRDNKDFYNAIYTLVKQQSQIIAKQAEVIEGLAHQVTSINQKMVPMQPAPMQPNAAPDMGKYFK